MSEDISFRLLFDDLPVTLSALLVESTLYGMHCILFFICLFFFRLRRKLVQLIIPVSIILMFGLSTVDVALSYRYLLQKAPQVLDERITLSNSVQYLLPKSHMYRTNNLIADALLIFRCYMVWGRQKYVLLVAVPILTVQTVLGYLSLDLPIDPRTAAITPVYFWIVCIFNILMTIFTAGRIWWVARSAHLAMEKQQIQRYSAIIAILVETGAVYSIVLLILAVIPSDKAFAVVVLAIAIRVVAIMPTLMVVQIELQRRTGARQSRNNRPSTANSSIRFGPTSTVSVPPPAICSRARCSNLVDSALVEIEKRESMA